MSWWQQSWWQQADSRWQGRSSSSNWWESRGQWWQDQAGSDQPTQGRDVQEAGSDRQTQEEEEEGPQRVYTYPRWAPTPTNKPRGQGAGGTATGWGKDTDHEWQPAWMRWSVLIDADLAKLGGDVRAKLFEQAKASYDCVASWRKDRHSENDMRVPYRLSVRGVEAQACMEWMLETLCSDHADLVDMQDIWSTPMPDDNQQTKVQSGLEGVIVRIFQDRQEPGTLEDGTTPVFLTSAPKVQPQMRPNVVHVKLQEARRMREEKGATEKRQA